MSTARPIGFGWDWPGREVLPFETTEQSKSRLQAIS
jgi:hypothetical protein